MSYVICEKESMVMLEVKLPGTNRTQWLSKKGATAALKKAAERNLIFDIDNFSVFEYKEYIKAKHLTL